VVAGTGWKRVAANTPWSSMAINSVSVFLGPNGRILAYSRSNQQVHHFPGIILAPSFPNNSANKGLARFLDVSGIPDISSQIFPFFGT